MFTIHVVSVIQDYLLKKHTAMVLHLFCVCVCRSVSVWAFELYLWWHITGEQTCPTEPRVRVKPTAAVSVLSPRDGPEWHRWGPSQQRDTALSIPSATENPKCGFFFNLALKCPCDQFKEINCALNPVHILKLETGAERALKAHLQVWCSVTKRRCC